MKGWTFVVPTLLLGGLLVATSGQTQEKGALDGAALVKERCTICHGAGRPLRHAYELKRYSLSIRNSQYLDFMRSLTRR